MQPVDLVIVGAGPAGMTAALYAKRKNLNVRIFERKNVGGTAADAILVENYPGTNAMSGKELMEKFEVQLKTLGIEIEKKEVTEIKKIDSTFEVFADDEKIISKAVLLATGTKYKKLNVKGEKEFFGKGVSYCALCDGPFFHGKTVAVVGAGNSGTIASLYLSEICKKVYLIEFLEKFGCDEYYQKKIADSKVEVLLGTEVKEIIGKNERVAALKVRERRTGNEKIIPTDGIFIYIGMSPQNELAKKIGAKIDKNGFVITDDRNHTSIDGLFAAGDITGKTAQIVVAAGSGAVAAVAAYEYIKMQQ